MSKILNCDNNGHSCLEFVRTKNTTSIDLVGCGTASNPLYATLNISDDEGNIIELRGDGIYAACCGSGEGSTIETNDTVTLNLAGDGSPSDPLFGDVNVSDFPGNSIQIFNDGLYVANTIQAGVVYGGIVTWLQDYDYYVSPSGYYINGIFYESPGGFFTLSDPDLIDDRIDTFIVDVDGNTTVLEGIPSPAPTEPPLDPALQLRLSIANVQTGTTEPGLAVECIYRNNLEWGTTSSSPTLDPNSVSGPCSGAKAIKATSVVNGVNIQFTRASAFNPTTSHSQLVMLLKVESWVATPLNFLRFQWTSSGIPVHAPVDLMDGVYALDVSVAGTCQIIAIPLNAFGLTSLSSVDGLLMTVNQVSNPLSFTLDDICLQGQPVPDPPFDSDRFVEVSENDTTPGRLFGTASPKITAGSNIVLTILNPGGDESLEISATAGDTLTFDNGLTRTLDNVQLGGTLLHDTVVDADTFQMDFIGTHANYVLGVNNSTAGTAGDFSSSGGIAVLGNGVFGGVFNGTTIGLQATSSADGGLAGLFRSDATTTNTSVRTVSVQRTTSGTAAAGLGATIQYDLENNLGGITAAGSLGMSWVTPTSTLESSRFNLNLVDGGVVARKLAVENTGQLILDEYGAGNFTGTDTFWLAVTANGEVIEMPAPSISGAITADNGLSMSPADNVELGGSPLDHNSTISTSPFWLTIDSSAATRTMSINNSGSGTGLWVVNTGSGRGIEVDAPNDSAIVATNNSAATTVDVSNAGSGTAVFGDSNTGIGGNFQSQTSLAINTNIFPVANNTVAPIMQLRRQVTGSAAAANGIGTSIDFMLTASTPASILQSNQIISKYTDVTVGARTSQLSFTGRSAGTLITSLILNGVGSMQAPEYGLGTFTGTPTFSLSVDTDGNIIETALPAGGLIYTVDNGLTEDVPNNFQLGGTLLHTTTINSNTFPLVITGSVAGPEYSLQVINNSASVTAAIRGEAPNALATGVSGTGGNIGVSGTSTVGAGGRFSATSGIGVSASATTGLAGSFQTTHTTNNDIDIVADFGRFTSSSPALDGIGGGISFSVHTDGGGSAFQSAVIASTWEDATHATRSGDLQIFLTKNSISEQKLVLSSDGSLQLNDYGGGTFTGTPTFFLATDASGNIIETDGLDLGVIITADNGLTVDPANNVQLGDNSAPGAPLLHDTFIDVGTNTLKLTGNDPTDGIFSIENTGSGGGSFPFRFLGVNSGMRVELTGNGTGLAAITDSGFPISASTDSGIPFTGSTNDGARAMTLTVNPGASASVQEIIRLIRNTSSGAGSDGIGQSINFHIEDDTTLSLANQIISRWDDVTFATRTSAMVFVGVDSATTQDILTLNGSGLLTANQYGTGAMTAGAGTFALHVDANGNIIEAAIGSGMTNPMSAEGDIIISDDGAGTPKRLAAGTSGFVLTSNGPGTEPSWQAAGGASGITRSVNSVSTPTSMGSAALTDYVYLVTGTTTVTLPTAVGNTNRYTVIRIDGSLTTTIATTGGQTINGAANVTLTSQYESVDLISNNSNWFII